MPDENIDGSKHHIWTGLRVTDVCVLKDGLRALFTANETKIILVNLENFEFVCTIQESDSISSLKLSGDSSNFLVNLASQQRKLVSTYIGHKQVYDNKVYVWNKKLVKCIDAMEGHQKTVNCVAWHPYKPIFCSASDDKTIIIWSK
ncbi:hypothetical protein O9G_001241 [Rozella allomycis CSF55]|uniref:Uncharacterized protein n=1 Tax=Rozella allomycis (strain CSF55) TaxID=988480 RepID=A0A075ATI9_ROZAC|nr:hypothetical protein O9G_001241 [Rozella allomycis CSF55]|eukprot:EPZ33490.1 hypothetical protein O9G_001241 [Rozella allomycis CSF55]